MEKKPETLEEIKQRRQAAYEKEISDALDALCEDDSVEIALARDEIRVKNGLPSALDETEILRQIARVGTQARAAVAEINSKYGVDGDKKKEDINQSINQRKR